MNGQNKAYVWSNGQLLKLKALRAQGKGAAAIATRLGISSGTVEYQLRKIEEPTRLAKQTALSSKSRRPCMCCGNTFWSQGIHNRLCVPCKRKEHSPYQP